MADLNQQIKDYLRNTKVMQLATSVGNKPWACNVHFYSDDKLNFYWISEPTRRHSTEIEQNQNVAAVVKIHEDTSAEPYVIGVSIEGKAEQMSLEEAEKIEALYVQKLGVPPVLFEDMKSGKNAHRFYRLTPSNIILFDTKNFPDNPRQEYKF